MAKVTSTLPIPSLPVPYTRFAHQFTLGYIGSPGEECTGEIVTVPDQTYSIRELLSRFTSGLMPAVGRQPQYDSDSVDGVIGFVDYDPASDPAFDYVDFQAHSESLLVQPTKIAKAVPKDPAPQEPNPPVKPEPLKEDLPKK